MDRLCRCHTDSNCVGPTRLRSINNRGSTRIAPTSKHRDGPTATPEKPRSSDPPNPSRTRQSTRLESPPVASEPPLQPMAGSPLSWSDAQIPPPAKSATTSPLQVGNTVPEGHRKLRLCLAPRAGAAPQLPRLMILTEV